MLRWCADPLLEVASVVVDIKGILSSFRSIFFWHVDREYRRVSNPLLDQILV